MPIDQFTLKLEQTKMLTPTVCHFVFNFKDNNTFQFIPGQFISIHFDYQGENLRRSYSIASIHGETSNLEIAVTLIPDGPGTKYLFSLKPNDEIKVSGPYGRLVLPNEEVRRYILIGTSTGITPYRSMLNRLKEKLANNNFSAIILQGVTSQEELLYQNDFLILDQKFTNFSFYAHYSRKMPTKPNQYEKNGYVQTTLEQLNISPHEDIVYLCGNPNMIEDVTKYLLNKGLSSNNIRKEKYYSKSSQ